MMNRTRGKTFLLALGLAAALGAAAQARDDARALDSTALRATVDGGAEMWPFEIYMDGAAYTWRIHFPSDVQYDGYLVAVREGSGPWNILDAKGRIRLDSPSEGLLNALSSSASFKQYPSEASPLEQGMPEDSAYYFPGWQAKEFQLARAPSNGHEAFTPLTTERMIEQVLPSPALLNPQGPVTAYVALKRKGSTTVDGLVITTEAEYVTGERAFFSKAAYAGKSYVQKALALMDTAFQGTASDTAFRSAALETYPGLSMSASDWTMFATDPDLPAMQKRMMTQFLNSSLSQTDYTEKGRVFDGLDLPTWQECLYGVNRLPEVASYFRYAYDMGMPLWSDSITEDHPGYDWEGYSPLSSQEGVGLARAALRYYTWGLDYALPTKGDSKPIIGPAVYAANKAGIEAWLSGDVTTRSVLNDYLPTTPLALDATTVPGSTSLPPGWASDLGADSPFSGGTAGSPLPFARGGTDGPRDFAQAMVGVYGSARKPGYALPPLGRGVDDLGLLTGSVAMGGLSGVVENLAGGHPGSSLETQWRTGVAGSGATRFIREDLEKNTILVPELGLLRPGDLVLHYGKGEGKSGDPLRLGVVVWVPATKPLEGQDAGSYLSQVLVVSAQEGTQQVRLASVADTFGTAVDEVHLRRMVRTKPLVSKLFDFRIGTTTPISFYLTVIADASFTYDRSYDCDYTGDQKSQRQRWIPNTGEYLVLQGLRINLKNAEGISMDLLSREIGTHYSIDIGLKDRDWDAAKADQGNIYDNTGTAFEIRALRPFESFSRTGGMQVSVLTKDTTPTTEADQSQSLYYSRPQTKNGLYVDEWGYVKYSFLSIFGLDQFGIRPSGGAFPGDDVLLTLDIWDQKGRVLRKAMDDKDYLAVYDKKMLWRANLYLIQPEADYGGKDWNDAFPWNAPPDDKTATIWAISGVLPAWGVKEDGTWDVATWGYNEWNRKMAKAPSFQNGAAVGLANLPAGKGGQVVALPTFTPLRTVPSGQTPGSGNQISGAVAYSYPMSKYEPQEWPQGTNGDPGSMDSPFDYLWKINKQRDLLAAAYDKSGAAKKTGSTTSWALTNAPGDSWANYSPGSTAQPGYLPGLGALFFTQMYFPSSIYLESGVMNLDRNAPYTFEAGADCIGFAQRAMGWKFAPGEPNNYKWHDLPPGLMEYSNGDGTDNYATVINQYVQNPRRFYPVPGSQSEAGVTIVQKKDRGTTPEQSTAFLAELRLVKPGDIFVVDGTGTGTWDSHIAIVASVPSDPNSIANVDDYMKKIVLIESTLAYKIQTVIDIMTVNDYDKTKFSSSDFAGKIYGSVDIPGGGLLLACTSWAIQRLTCVTQ